MLCVKRIKNPEWKLLAGHWTWVKCCVCPAAAVCACLKKKWTDKTDSGDQFKQYLQRPFCLGLPLIFNRGIQAFHIKTRGVLKLEKLLKQQHLKQLPQPPAEMLYVFVNVCLQSMLWKQVCQGDCDIVNDSGALSFLFFPPLSSSVWCTSL